MPPARAGIPAETRAASRARSPRIGSSASTPPRILISGSLYLAGDVLAANGTPPT